MALLSTLSDDFADGTMGSQWTTASSGSIFLGNSTQTSYVSESGGVLNLSIGTSGTGAGGYVSSATYDFTNSVIQGKVVPASSSSLVDTWLIVGVDSNNWVAIGKYSTTLYCRTVIASTQTDRATPTYSSTNHVWWRLRHGTYASGTSGHVYFDTAPDSSGQPGTWTTQYDLTSAGFTVTAVKAELAVNTWSNSGIAGSATFDNVNQFAQTAAPVADVDNSGLYTTDTSGTTNLYQAIDETTASDTDYIQSPLPANGGSYTCRLGTIVQPQSGTWTLQVRYRKPAAGRQIDLQVEVLDGSTVKDTFNSAGTGTNGHATAALGNITTSWQTQTLTLSGAYTSYADLRARFTFTQI